MLYTVLYWIIYCILLSKAGIWLREVGDAPSMLLFFFAGCQLDNFDVPLGGGFLMDAG